MDVILWSYSVKIFLDQEKNFTNLYNINKTNEKEKLKWIQVLESLPFYIMIYDKLTK